MKDLQMRADTLIEALPYIQQWAGKTIVVKYGGAAMTDPQMQDNVAQDLVLLRYVGINVVAVHGGGQRITEMMRRLGIEPEFAGGLRVTDAETMEIAQMVLVGNVNQQLVSLINAAGGRAVGLSGQDGSMIISRKKESGEADLGFVGEIVSIDTEVVQTLIGAGFIPVVSSIGGDAEGQSYNINADTVAGQLACELQAVKLVTLSDVAGLLEDPDDPTTLISKLTVSEAKALIADGNVAEGMLPKLESCIQAVAGGVERAHIIDGCTPHALLMELFTDAGIGTMINPG